MIEEFNELCNQLKSKAVIKTVDVYRFKIELSRMSYTKSTEVKKAINATESVVEAFKLYKQPYKYIKELEKLNIDRGIIYKGLIDFKSS